MFSDIYVSLSAQNRRWTEEKVAWIQRFQCLIEIIGIDGRFRCIFCLSLKMFLISTISITENAIEAQRNMQHETTKKDQKAKKIINKCSSTHTKQQLNIVRTTKPHQKSNSTGQRTSTDMMMGRLSPGWCSLSPISLNHHHATTGKDPCLSGDHDGPPVK